MEEKPGEVTKYVDITVGSRNYSTTLEVEGEVLASVTVLMLPFPVHLLSASVGDIMVDLVDLLT